jgi:hypothetical protein
VSSLVGSGQVRSAVQLFSELLAGCAAVKEIAETPCSSVQVDEAEYRPDCFLLTPSEAEVEVML